MGDADVRYMAEMSGPHYNDNRFYRGQFSQYIKQVGLGTPVFMVDDGGVIKSRTKEGHLRKDKISSENFQPHR